MAIDTTRCSRDWILFCIGRSWGERSEREIKGLDGTVRLVYSCVDPDCEDWYENQVVHYHDEKDERAYLKV